VEGEKEGLESMAVGSVLRSRLIKNPGLLGLSGVPDPCSSGVASEKGRPTESEQYREERGEGMKASKGGIEGTRTHDYREKGGSHATTRSSHL